MLSRFTALAACVCFVTAGCSASPDSTSDPSSPSHAGSGGSSGKAGSGNSGGAPVGGSSSGGNTSGGTSSGGTTATGGSGGSNVSIDDVSSDFEPIRAQYGLPALGGAVWNGNQMIAEGMTGVRKQGDPTPATVDDEWHLGSCTKAMTATLIGIYVDQGVIHFEDTLPTLFAGENIDPGYFNVTLLDLLRHIGGVPGEFSNEVATQMYYDGYAPDARIKAALAILAQPPGQAQGNFVYSNGGYVIAGAALERATGSTWEALIQSDLFAPLGMASCGFGAPGTPGQVDEPWGHGSLNPGQFMAYDPGDPSADNPPAMGPAGTVHCTLADWGKFLSLHLAGLRGESTSLVSTSTMTVLHTPPNGGDYAAGWGVTQRDWAGGLTITHSGSNLLWMVTTWIAPAKNRVFAVVTNDGDDPALTGTDDAFGPLIDKYAN